MHPSDPIAAAAEDLIAGIARPRRRKAPRVAQALTQAEHRMIDGVAAWRLGEGPAVLLVHGWEDDTSLFGPLIDALQARFCPVVALDLPAHGYSEGDTIDIETAARAVAAVARGFGPIKAAIGHSFGCKALAFAVAWEGAAFERLALIGSPTSQRSQWGRIVTRHGVPPEVAAHALALREQRLGFSIDRYDLAALGEAMTMPVLFLHSADDDACPVDEVQAVVPRWPKARLLLTDGLGHRLVAQDPDTVAAVVDFIDP
jgi:pimeloyl-ACP methyl ester carboxylesterase